MKPYVHGLAQPRCTAEKAQQIVGLLRESIDARCRWIDEFGAHWLYDMSKLQGLDPPKSLKMMTRNGVRRQAQLRVLS